MSSSRSSCIQGMLRGGTTLEGGGHVYLAAALRHACVEVSSDSCACGRVSWSSSSRSSSSWYSASSPIRVRRSELSVAGILLLGFYVLLDLFVFFVFFFSSSSCLDRRFRLLWFRSFSFSFSLGLVLGTALVLIYDENRMGAFIIIIIICIMFFFMSCVAPP